MPTITHPEFRKALRAVPKVDPDAEMAPWKQIRARRAAIRAVGERFLGKRRWMSLAVRIARSQAIEHRDWVEGGHSHLHRPKTDLAVAREMARKALGDATITEAARVLGEGLAHMGINAKPLIAAEPRDAQRRVIDRIISFAQDSDIGGRWFPVHRKCYGYYRDNVEVVRDIPGRTALVVASWSGWGWNTVHRFVDLGTKRVHSVPAWAAVRHDVAETYVRRKRNAALLVLIKAERRIPQGTEKFLPGFAALSASAAIEYLANGWRACVRHILLDRCPGLPDHIIERVARPQAWDTPTEGLSRCLAEALAQAYFPGNDFGADRALRPVASTLLGGRSMKESELREFCDTHAPSAHARMGITRLVAASGRMVMGLRMAA